MMLRCIATSAVLLGLGSALGALLVQWGAG